MIKTFHRIIITDKKWPYLKFPIFFKTQQKINHNHLAEQKTNSFSLKKYLIENNFKPFYPYKQIIK